MKFYKWTVEFQVAACWVADGFEMTDDSALQMLSNDLGWAHIDTELKAKVLTKPTDKSIATEQGYKSVAAWKKSNK